MVFFLGLRFLPWNAIRVETFVFFDITKTHIIYIERWISQHIVEAAKATEWVIMVGIGLLDLPSEPVYGKIHLCKVYGFKRLLLAIHIYTAVRIFQFLAMFID